MAGKIAWSCVAEPRIIADVGFITGVIVINMEIIIIITALWLVISMSQNSEHTLTNNEITSRNLITHRCRKIGARVRFRVYGLGF